MKPQAIYQVQRGTDAALYLEAISGDPSQASNCISKLKKTSSPNAPTPPDSQPACLTITPIYTPAAPPLGAGWTIPLTAVETAALAIGFYILDFACTIAGGEVATAPVIVEIINAVSVP